MGRGRAYFGWYVVAACFGLAVFGWGLGFYGLGVYIVELRARHGWSAGVLSTATTVFYLAGAVCLVLFVEAVRRWGPRPTVLVGVGAMAVGTASLPLASAIWQVFGAYVVMSVGWSAMSSTAIATLLAPWFTRRRGLAISIALSGASIGGILIPPALLWLIGRWGFAVAVDTVAASMLVLLAPVLWRTLGPRGPAPISDDRPGGRAKTLREARFWGVAVPFALGLTAQVGFLTHQIAFLAPRLGTQGAGFAVSVTTAAALVGRFGLGLIVDALPVRWVTAAVFASQAAALLVLAVVDPSNRLATIAACGVFGLSVGNVVTLPSLVVQREFPAVLFATVIGLSTAVGQVTYAFGPALVGLAHDATGGYRLSLGLCVAFEVVAALIMLRPRPAALLGVLAWRPGGGGATEPR